MPNALHNINNLNIADKVKEKGLFIFCHNTKSDVSMLSPHKIDNPTFYSSLDRNYINMTMQIIAPIPGNNCEGEQPKEACVAIAGDGSVVARSTPY